jgi:hypothetical protein
MTDMTNEAQRARNLDPEDRKKRADEAVTLLLNPEGLVEAKKVEGAVEPVTPTEHPELFPGVERSREVDAQYAEHGARVAPVQDER